MSSSFATLLTRRRLRSSKTSTFQSVPLAALIASSMITRWRSMMEVPMLGCWCPYPCGSPRIETAEFLRPFLRVALGTNQSAYCRCGSYRVLKKSDYDSRVRAAKLTASEAAARGQFVGHRTSEDFHLSVFPTVYVHSTARTVEYRVSAYEPKFASLVLSRVNVGVPPMALPLGLPLSTSFGP